MQLAPKQLDSILDAYLSRINIWHGAVRSGKTVGSIVRFLEILANPPKGGHIVIVGKTERTIKRNILSVIADHVGKRRVKLLRDGMVAICGVVCLMVGANDARAETKIRGGTFAVAYVDEITLCPESFFKMLLSRLSVPGATLLGTTNPDSPYHWLKRDYIDRRDELHLKLFHFTLDDNPFLASEYVEALKLEYTGLWYRRFILGEWCLAEGAVYADQWDEARNTWKGPYTPQVKWWAAGDYGTTNPTTFGLYSEDRAGVVTCWSEYWWDSRAEQRQKTDQQYVADFFMWLQRAGAEVAADARAAGLPPPLTMPAFLRLDPAAASLRVAFEQDRRIRIENANNDVLQGIRHVGGRLAAGTFLVHKRCTHSHREMSAYTWDPKAQARGEDAPIKINDHTQDRHRYAMYAPAFKPDSRTSAQRNI